MDSDGDLDLFLFGLDESDTISTNTVVENLRYFLEIQENIGNKYNPVFKEREKRFEDFNYPTNGGFCIPDINDLNGDGKQDIVISAEVDSFQNQYLRFDTQTSDNKFETTLCDDYDLSPFIKGSTFFPELVDLDMDGDLDLLLSGGIPSFKTEDSTEYYFIYAKNTGSMTEPAFLGWFTSPYGLQANTFPEFLTSGDIDMDGDIDILGLRKKDTLTTLEYYENKAGSDGRPVFSSSIPSPFGLPVAKKRIESFYFPSLVDIDGDGDLDMFLPRNRVDTLLDENNNYVLDTAFVLEYYENQMCIGGYESIAERICMGDTIYINDQIFTTSGEWDIEVTNEQGCVSVTHLTLEVLPVSTTNIKETLCYGDTFYINNNSFTESGIYELSLQSITGCDSTVIADLDFVKIDTTYIVETFCYGEVYNFNGVDYTETGIYETTMQSHMGCDSTIIADLEFIKIDTTFVEETLCYGEKYIVGDDEFTETGIYEIDLVSTFGCDSVVFADLEFVELDTSVLKEGSVLTAHFDTDYYYQWFDCITNEDISGAKENVFEPDYSGKFAVRISNDMGCSQVSGCYDVIASGLIATDMENALEVMPNPTKGLITIFNKTGLKIESVDLYSMSGQSMKKYYLDKDNSFDISGYSEGIYLIRIAINNKIIVRRIILIK